MVCLGGMSKEYPPQPIPENEAEAIHQDFEQVQEAVEATPQQPFEAPEIVEEKISGIKEEIERAMAKKDTGAEPLESDFVVPTAPVKKENWFSSKWRKALVTFGIIGAVAGANASDKTPGKSDQLPTSSEKVRTIDNEDSTYSAHKINKEKLEALGIYGIETLKQPDTTKEVFLIGIEKGKDLKEILSTIKKAGFRPSSYETMDRAAKDNKKLYKNAGYVMSLEETVFDAGPGYPVVVTTGNGTFLEVRNIGGDAGEKGGDKRAVFDIDSSEYTFIVERDTPTIADYASLAK